jgi:site-specific recombinase XerD
LATTQGTQIDPSNLRKLFNRLLTDAKLRRVRFHDLSHSFASLLLSQGQSPTYVMEQMGTVRSMSPSIFTVIGSGVDTDGGGSSGRQRVIGIRREDGGP